MLIGVQRRPNLPLDFIRAKIGSPLIIRLIDLVEIIIKRESLFARPSFQQTCIIQAFQASDFTSN